MICLAAAIVQFIILGIHNNFGILYTYLMDDLKAEPSDTGKISKSSDVLPIVPSERRGGPGPFSPIGKRWTANRSQAL